MTPPRAWPRGCFESSLLRPMLRHQFWRKFLGSIGPRYMLAPVEGADFYLDLREHLGVSRFIFKHGVHERTVSKLLAEWIGGSGSVIDVGANLGYFSVLSARQTTGTVYSFEPEPHAYRLLQANVAVNGLDNVVTANCAAGSERGVSRLFVSEHNAGDHKLFDSEDASGSVEVEVVPLDEELASLDDLTFVKIDVQGLEERVVRGMRELLTRNRGVSVLSEFEPGSIEASGDSGDSYLDFMESLGFGWLAVDEERGGLVSLDRSSLYERCGPNGYVNLWFSRG